MIKNKFKSIFFIICIIFSTLVANCSEKIDILYTIDNNYTIFTLISIDSILKNNTSNSEYHFHIIENNLTDKNKIFIQDFIKKRNQNISFYNIDSKIINNRQVYDSTRLSYITSIALARLFITDILPNDINKIIYIDADTLIISDLQPLYKTDLKNKLAGLILNNEQKIYSKKLYDFKNGYYNSGVILIDLNQWRKVNLSKTFEKYYIDNIDNFTSKKGDNKEYFFLVDQDLINLVLDGKIYPLHPKWNQQYKIKYKEGIIHYIGKNKPWKICRSSYAKKIYLSHWNSIPELRKYRFIYFHNSLLDNYETFVTDKIIEHRIYLENIKKKAISKIYLKNSL